MESTALTTVFHQCTSAQHSKVCAPVGKPAGMVRVQESMPKGSGDVVYELHLLPAELKEVGGQEHEFDVNWEDAVRHPYQIYTR